MKTSYDTVTEAIEGLLNEGYTEDFNLLEDSLVCRQNHFRLFQEEFVVDAVYRFEGDTDPGDEAVVYAISSDKHNLKGVLTDAYGKDSNALTTEMVQKLSYRKA